MIEMPARCGRMSDLVQQTTNRGDSGSMPASGPYRASRRGDFSISIRGVSKRYRLYPSPMARVMDVFGLRKLLNPRESIPEFEALHGVSIDIRHAERVALVGRNGAGKSTLLKLISGNFGPSSGAIDVYGRVSALLEMGLGFHEDFPGIDNIRSSLAYNGLTASEFDAAVADVIEFCELGPFIDLPVKSYSAGMRARLYFAVATAIKPDILVIDEILGAGDAYFGARSAERMAQIVDGRCTLVLVSHNLAQIMEMCDRAIWIEAGRVQLDGPAVEIVKAYQEFSLALEERHLEAKYGGQGFESADRWIRRRLLGKNVDRTRSATPNPNTMSIAVDAQLRSPQGRSIRRLEAGEELEVAIHTELRRGRTALRVRPVVHLFTADGRLVDRSLGPILMLSRGVPLTSTVRYAPLLIGAGEYLVAGGVVEADNRNEAFLGIFARSLRFEVAHPDPTETSLVLQPASWTATAL